MKKISIALICFVAVISVVFNILKINDERKISNHISNYIIANTHQLSTFYETMYSDGEPTRYYESSLLYIDDVCDSIKEEIVFYSTIYPKRNLFLGNIIDDYKLVIRVMKNNPALAEEAQLLHKQLQQYIADYDSDNVDYKNNRAKSLFDTDKMIKENDNNNYYSLHDKIVKLSKK